MDIERKIQELNADRPSTRAEAAYSLGESRAADAVGALVKGLADSDDQVRMNCVWALGEIGDPSALAPLFHSYSAFKTASSGKGYRQSKAITTYLYSIVQLMDYAQLMDFFGRGDQYEKIVVLHALHQKHSPASLQFIRTVLDDNDLALRQVARDLLQQPLKAPPSL
jgi:hypothetical protein